MSTPVPHSDVHRIQEIAWYHSIQLPGITTPGDCPLSVEQWTAGAIPTDLTGKTVLDVGAWDGYFSFEAERRGATRVLAIDSLQGPHGEIGTDGFELARAVLGSRVEYRVMSVMDVDTIGETFDVILFFGVYYHLADPCDAFQLLFRRLRPGGMLLIEGLVAPGKRSRLHHYHPRDVEPTTFCAGTLAWFDQVLSGIGFRDVACLSGTWRIGPAMRYYAGRFPFAPVRALYVLLNLAAWSMRIQAVPWRRRHKAYRALLRAVKPRRLSPRGSSSAGLRTASGPPSPGT